MPLYDYSCAKCGHVFEALVRSDTKPVCASCGSAELERLMSTPMVSSDATRDQALRAARKRDAALGKDRMHEQLRYEQTHDRHG